LQLRIKNGFLNCSTFPFLNWTEFLHQANKILLAECLYILSGAMYVSLLFLTSVSAVFCLAFLL
jgi:hypothetical protein